MNCILFFEKMVVEKYLKVPLTFLERKQKNCAKETLCVYTYGNNVFSYQMQQSEYEDLL